MVLENREKGSESIQNVREIECLSSSPPKKMVLDNPKRCPKCGGRMYYNYLLHEYVCESCGYQETLKW